MKLQANLPAHVKKFHYVKNSHYIEFEDVAGNKHKVLATDLLKGDCQACDFLFYTPSNHGDIRCPICLGRIRWSWGKLQLCFVPEIESDFSISKPEPDLT